MSNIFILARLSKKKMYFNTLTCNLLCSYSRIFLGSKFAKKILDTVNFAHNTPEKVESKLFKS